MNQTVWVPTQEQVERTNVWRFMQELGISSAAEFRRHSTNHLEAFWDAVVRKVGIEWFEPYRQTLDTSQGVEWARWFVGGQLNVVHNCLDRHAGSGRTALIAEAEDGTVRTLSFAELHAEVSRLANAFDAMGLRPRDRVALCLPMGVEVVIALYACLKRGLMAVPIFSGYGAGAIATRLADSGTRLVVTAESIRRRGKSIALRAKVEEALQAQGHQVERLLVAGSRHWDDLLGAQPTAAETLRVESEHPALLLYTSGTTGKPKGTVHTHAGSLAQMAKEIWLGFDNQPDDVFWWLSDMGWMMGPWTVIGNHHFGGTVVLYDGAPDFPDAGRLWSMVERHRVTTFGVSPTAIRLLMRHGPELPARHDLSSLRLLGSTGEPWDDTSYRWFFDHVGRGRCPIINISGGTEIVGCFLFPLPMEPLKSCTLGGPAPGMATEVVDEAGQPVRGRTGYLVCTQPAPSMTRGIWGDPERYLRTYWSRFPGWWFHGDWASVDEDGLWYLHGRADESMNVAGRKVGPAEVEEALIAHPAVSEAAVIGVPDDLTGEAIVGFVVARKGQSPDLDEVARHVVSVLGPTFRPRELRLVAELPKTQSGKVVRRAIRQRYLGQDVGDLSTVENPRALDSV